MLSSIELSRVLISQATSKGIPVCNLKLQKLLYYIQGYHLACTGSPIFSDEIAAWQHGPVVGTAYHAYKEYGYQAIPVIHLAQDIEIDTFQSELIDYVLETYGHQSGWELRNQTHNESPWLQHSSDGIVSDGKTITEAELLDFFNTKVDMDGFSLKSHISSIEDTLANDFVAVPDEIQCADDFVLWAKSVSFS